MEGPRGGGEVQALQFGSIGYEGIDLEASKEMGITVSKGFFDGLAVS
jgi:lactate dehydrogenase-like 2-hydroxyacid dehydrogenase